MKVEEILKIGERVEIEMLDTGQYAGHYLSKIEDFDGEKVLVGLPIEKGHVVPLRIGGNVNIYITKKDGVYYFPGLISQREMRPIPYFVINYPTKLNRIQRRNYVRITINTVISFSILPRPGEEEKECKIEKGVSINISGGGCYILAIKELEIGEKLALNFSLPNGVLCNEIKGVVRRKEITQEKGKIKYGVEFVEISEKLREKIIGYLFELQRDRKTKGIDI